MNTFMQNSKQITEDLIKEAHREAPVYCHLCGKVITDPLDLEFFEAVGVCAGCDHVRGSIEKEMLDEMCPSEEAI